jgi:hypothetical protein
MGLGVNGSMRLGLPNATRIARTRSSPRDSERSPSRQHPVGLPAPGGRGRCSALPAGPAATRCAAPRLLRVARAVGPVSVSLSSSLAREGGGAHTHEPAFMQNLDRGRRSGGGAPRASRAPTGMACGRPMVATLILVESPRSCRHDAAPAEALPVRCGRAAPAAGWRPGNPVGSHRRRLLA